MLHQGIGCQKITSDEHKENDEEEGEDNTKDEESELDNNEDGKVFILNMTISMYNPIEW